jgi:hypothetical protein
MKKLLSIFRLQCPCCHKGEFLESPPRPLFKIIRVREQCTHCPTRFKIEPSFYYGSMYVAYALGVALMLGVTLIYWVLSDSFSVGTAFLWISGILLIVSPYLNAWSKLIWANLFFHYQPDLKKKND